MITIDPASAVAPFEQLRGQLAASVRSGELTAGSRLPTVRKLAGDLGLAPNTVARAFRELEADGLVETRGRNGTVVRAQGGVAESAAQDAARAYAELVHRGGVDAADALRFVEAALASLHVEPDPAPAADGASPRRAAPTFRPATTG